IVQLSQRSGVALERDSREHSFRGTFPAEPFARKIGDRGMSSSMNWIDREDRAQVARCEVEVAALSVDLGECSVELDLCAAIRFVLDAVRQQRDELGVLPLRLVQAAKPDKRVGVVGIASKRTLQRGGGSCIVMHLVHPYDAGKMIV